MTNSDDDRNKEADRIIARLSGQEDYELLLYLEDLRKALQNREIMRLLELQQTIDELGDRYK